jgi:enhancing lycopene biosynthesis protein 2
MDRVGLFLSGSGSLDGSDIFSSVMVYHELQRAGYEPVPVGRDISQGEVLNHRTAESLEQDRNALDEAARIVRGKIKDMRRIDVDRFQAAVFVGGGGTLSTWTDYHQRGADCRVTERLKYQVLDLHKGDKPMLALGNAGFALGMILKEVVESLQINLGNNSRINSLAEDWGITLTNESPSWDANHALGSLPDPARTEDLPEMRASIHELLKLAELN